MGFVTVDITFVIATQDGQVGTATVLIVQVSQIVMAGGYAWSSWERPFVSIVLGMSVSIDMYPSNAIPKLHIQNVMYVICDEDLA